MPNETITDRLAIGLARQAIRAWRAQVERSQQRLTDLLFHGVSTGKAARLDEQATQPALAAKTWISSKTAGPRDEAVVSSIVRAFTDWMKAIEPPALIPFLLMHARVPEDLVDSLCAALEPHAWLKEPYAERPDHLSRLWAAAREQANADSP